MLLANRSIGAACGEGRSATRSIAPSSSRSSGRNHSRVFAHRVGVPEGGPRRAGRGGRAGSGLANAVGAASAHAGGGSRIDLRVYLLYLAVAFILAVALSWSYSQTARLGYRIGELKNEIARLDSENEKLAYELSGLSAIARIEEEAIERLGMVRPAHVRVGPPGQPETSVLTDPGRDVAMLIHLASPDDPLGDGETASTEPASRRGFVGSLWERIYRWLTGASQAEASDWN